MSDPKQWYATYNPERDSFIVEDAGWEGEHPVIEYRLMFYLSPRSGRKFGVIDKIWMEGGHLWNEIYIFKPYRSKKACEEDLIRIMEEAKELARSKNRDYFMCILDRVKVRAVRAGLEYASIKYYDELFDIGPIDAYRWLLQR
jgi:hypothetical protein